MIAKHIPEYKVEKIHKNEAFFTLPTASVNSFYNLFNEIERKSNELGIESYAVSMTTLEEVFLKLRKIILKLQIKKKFNLSLNLPKVKLLIVRKMTIDLPLTAKVRWDFKI